MLRELKKNDVNTQQIDANALQLQIFDFSKCCEIRKANAATLYFWRFNTLACSLFTNGGNMLYRVGKWGGFLLINFEVVLQLF